MTAFLWTMIVLMALMVIGKLIWLAEGKIPERNPKHLAVDIVLDAALIVWASILLAFH